MRVVEDINRALHEIMELHSDVRVIGEDILDPYGGAFKVTKGLADAFGSRVMTMPISEAGLVGFGLGMSMRGKPVIAEIMFGDFLSLTLDQLLNHASKVHWMFNETVTAPLIVRTPMGGGRGYGPTHSQSIEKHFCGIPGLTVLAVNQYQSPGDLLKRAFDLKSPVLFVENKVMYSKMLAPGDIKAEANPDVVIIGYGGVLEACVKAAAQLAEEEEIVVRIVPVEQLSPIDVKTILTGVGDCRRVLAVEEGVEGWGFGAECGRLLLESPLRNFRFGSVAAPPIPIPNSRDWEVRLLPNVTRVIEGVMELLGD